MENGELSRIWQKAVELIAPTLSDLSYSSWIKPIELARLDESGAVFTVENDFKLAYVRERYSALIAGAMERVLGRNVRCEFVLPAELAPRRVSGANITLNPKYTFESFVVGSSNRFAQAAAIAVANNPGTAYNPLFIYGGVGLGKTHLMHAIGNHLVNYKPDTRILYVTSEAFTNDLINAIQNKRNLEFKERYRSLDILLIDDIQFIAGRDSTQEEIANTFNELYQNNKQIVISSDKRPEQISQLEERLVSRFGCGLVADVQKPDYETTVAILRKKAESYDIPDDVILLIAQYVFNSVREMEGALNRVVAKAAILEKPVTRELAQEVMGDLHSIKDPKRVTPDIIMETVAQYFSISTLDLKSQKRSREIVIPRQIAMYLMREMISLPFRSIGCEFSGQHYSTVMHSCEKISAEMKQDFKLEQSVDDIMKMVNNV